MVDVMRAVDCPDSTFAIACGLIRTVREVWLERPVGVWLLLFLIYLFTFGTAGAAFAKADILHPIMHPDPETLQQWNENYRNAPVAVITPERRDLAQRQGAFSIMSYSPWNASNIYQRNQASCGDCWVWANTAAAEIALSVNNSTTNRLSIQLFNGCWLGDNGKHACCGGDPTDFAKFYNSTQQYMVPWLNANANFADGFVSACDTTTITCANIATAPQYQVATMTASKIATTQQASGVPVSNIKAILNNNQAVTYAMTLPNSAAWDAFDTFWDNDDESTLFDPGTYSGITYGSGGGGGGHEMLIVGYDDTDPNNSYWLVLNSWGASANRPNGFWHLAMNTNYDAYYVDSNNTNQPMQGFWQLSATFTLPSNVGSLAVTMAPAPVPLLGAMWQVDGGGWQQSGTTMAGLSPGTHTVAFSNIVGFTTPAAQTVTVSQGATASVSARYVLDMTGGANLLPTGIPLATSTSGFANGFVESFLNLDDWTQNSLATWTTTNYLVSVTGTKSGNSFNLTYNQSIFSNFDYSVALRRSSAHQDGNAIYFRGVSTPQDSSGDWNAGYWFGYSNSGTFMIATVTGNALTELVDWSPTSAVVPFDWNILRVVASGSSLQFFINGTQVYTTTNSAYASGQLGIEMWDGSGGTLDVKSAVLSVGLPQVSTSAAASAATPQAVTGPLASSGKPKMAPQR
jgi:C1A family cysteine protease